MKIRNVIENDIVEDISIYKNIYNGYIEIIKLINPKFETRFSFDDFCIKMINNFDGVDKEMRECFEYREGNPLTKKLLDSIILIASEDLDNDQVMIKKLMKIIKDY